MLEQVNVTSRFLQDQGIISPEIGIILGTGLSGLTDWMEIIHTLPYDRIPHFPVATVESHHGKLVYGNLEGKLVLAMQGRFHYYEGYSMSEVVYPVRVMKQLGIKSLLISNAGGCMNLQWRKGELMLISDHINLLPDNPLRGKDAAAFGPIFTDMSNPYDHHINQKLRQIAQKAGITLHEGVYVAVPGPSLETRAEYRMLKDLGADVVGMSTVPEVIAANQMKLPVSAISVLTDECDPENLHPIDIEEIIRTAKTAEQKLIRLFQSLMREL